MYLEVYPDIIFILNFFLDFIILTILKLVSRKKSRIGKRILAAVIGAIAAAIIGIFPWMNIVIRFIFLNIGAATLMLILAFGRMKRTELAKQLIVLYLITYFFGGLINSIFYHTGFRLFVINFGTSIGFSNASWETVFLIAIFMIPGVSLLLWLYRWYKSGVSEIVDVELVFHGRMLITKGLIDSGNCLYDPIFKKPVIVIEGTQLTNLLSPEENLELAAAKDCLNGNAAASEVCFEDVTGLLPMKIIPYQSIGKKHGIMLGIVLDKVLIYQGKETICNEKITAAICDNCLSTKEEYHVILHKELFT